MVSDTKPAGDAAAGRRSWSLPIAIDDEELALRFRTIHGYRRAFRMAGSGPAILLLHGIGDSSESWLPLIPALSERYTVIAPDLLGHGQSDKPRADYAIGAFANGMRDLLNVLEIDRVTVVGHSLGGGVAAQFAYQFPDLCERLVLVATGGVGPQVSAILRLATAPFSELVFPLLGSRPVRVGRSVVLGILRYSGDATGQGRRRDQSGARRPARRRIASRGVHPHACGQPSTDVAKSSRCSIAATLPNPYRCS